MTGPYNYDSLIHQFGRVMELETERQAEIKRHAERMASLKSLQTVAMERVTLEAAGINQAKLIEAEGILEIAGKASVATHPHDIELADTVISDAITSLRTGKGTGYAQNIMDRRYCILQNGNGQQRQRRNLRYDDAYPSRFVMFAVGIKPEYRRLRSLMQQQIEAVTYYLQNIRTIEEARTKARVGFESLQALGLISA